MTMEFEEFEDFLMHVGRSVDDGVFLKEAAIIHISMMDHFQEPSKN